MTQVSVKVAVLGAGSWGTALSIYLSRQGYLVSLWDRNITHVKALKETYCNARYLPDINIPSTVCFESDLRIVLQDSAFLILAVPSHAVAEVLQQIKQTQSSSNIIVCISKGLAQGGKFLFEVAQTILGTECDFAQLSGPSFASEVAKQVPTAVTLSANREALALKLQGYLHSTYFRVYLSHDLIGVSLCGAVKNVLAIAVGIADGLGLGANTRAALITRGLAEMVRLGKALGADPNTFMGLAGVGDLVLTCTDNQSRNRRFGVLLGQGNSKEAAQAQIQRVVEGIHNTITVRELARLHRVEMPITEQLYKILQERKSPEAAIQQLLHRQAREENG